MAKRVRLTWTDTNNLETSVNVYRSEATIDPQNLPIPIATLPANSTEYLDEAVTLDVTYFYRVSAVNSGGEEVSSEVSVTVATALPAIGEFWAEQGGYYAGTAANGNRVIISAKSSEVSGQKWKSTNTATPGTDASTAQALNAAIIASGLANHPAASYCNALTLNGFTDWMLPGTQEFSIIHGNLNPNNAGTPSPFKAGESQAFNTVHPQNYYWSSTTTSDTTARAGRPSSPTYWNYGKTESSPTTRAIRVIPT